MYLYMYKSAYVSIRLHKQGGLAAFRYLFSLVTYPCPGLLFTRRPATRALRMQHMWWLVMGIVVGLSHDVSCRASRLHAAHVVAGGIHLWWLVVAGIHTTSHLWWLVVAATWVDAGGWWQPPVVAGGSHMGGSHHPMWRCML